MPERDESDERHGDYAEGEEQRPPPEHEGDFAEGQESEHPDHPHHGSFAEGQEDGGARRARGRLRRGPGRGQVAPREHAGGVHGGAGA